ncbi:MAG: hypothetical protein ACI87E_000805 [Mariniblastus sp.]|jgi:hypothetical protein
MSKPRYGISAVQYDRVHNRINSVQAHTVSSDNKLSDLRIYPRSAVIKAIEEQGIGMVTLPSAHDGKYTIGAEVIVVEVLDQKFLKTSYQETECDNLGELPEF